MSNALLLAQPDPPVSGFLQRHLTDDGFQVLGANGVGEALEVVERERPDLVLSDTALPDASGLDLCRRLREGEPGRSWNRDVPVILLGHNTADAVDRVRGFARGCDDYVPRPFHYEELLARIRAVLRRARPAARDQLHAGDISSTR